MNAQLLPAPFQDLAPYLEWSIATERERMVKREATAMPEIIDFHKQMSARLEEIVTYLNQYPYAEMPDDAQCLCNMALSLVEVCNLVELWKNPDLLNAVRSDRFVPHE